MPYLRLPEFFAKHRRMCALCILLPFLRYAEEVKETVLLFAAVHYFLDALDDLGRGHQLGEKVDKLSIRPHEIEDDRMIHCIESDTSE